MKNWILPLALVTSAVSAQAPCMSTAQVTSLGSGTPGSLGVPVLTVVGAPEVGEAFALQVQNGAPDSQGLIVFSEETAAAPQPVPQYGGVFYPGESLHVLPFDLDDEGMSPLLHVTSALGPEVCGRLCVLQAAMLDANAIGGVSLTAGLDVEFGVAGTDPSKYFLSPGAQFDTGERPSSVAISDLNGDGMPDLAVANNGSDNVSILLGAGDGSFGAAQNYAAGNGPVSVGVSDLNGDGLPDLAVASNLIDRVVIRLGVGDGSFGVAHTFAAGNRPLSFRISDLDGDGVPDLAVVNGKSGTVSILLGAGGGSFGAVQTFVVGFLPVSVGISDLNGDGIQDLAVANIVSGNVSILLGAGDGSFGAVQNFSAGSGPQSVGISDLNGDGIADIAVANAGSDNLSILLGLGGGRFGAAQNFAAGNAPRSIGISDFNGDGMPDIVVAFRPEPFGVAQGGVTILLGSEH